MRDRVVQAALKNILEPIFEADFFPCSYGFRPCRGAHGALELLRKLLRPVNTTTKNGKELRFPYQWAIEGDIRGCFDNIAQHGLMERVRLRVVDRKANRLIVAFLKAGVMAEKQFLRSPSGTPQGGILSPLLANIALSVIEERYERHAWPRRSPTPLREAKRVQIRAASNRKNDKCVAGKPVLYPVRYADDFLVLVSAPLGQHRVEKARQIAFKEKAELARVLKETLGLELSEEKTAVTPVTKPISFLGHHVRVQHSPMYGWASKCVIPKDRSRRLRAWVKELFSRRTRHRPLKERLDRLNPKLRGWSAYYRHAWGAKAVFCALDSYVWWTIGRWLWSKHVRVKKRHLRARYGHRKPGCRASRWRDGKTGVFRMASQRVERYKHAWMRPPDFVSTPMESPVHNERCTPGSVRGARKPARATG